MIKSVRTRWAGRVTFVRMGNACVILTGVFEGKKPLGRLKWEDDSKIAYFFSVRGDDYILVRYIGLCMIFKLLLLLLL
jgi:hypothetical protein